MTTATPIAASFRLLRHSIAASAAPATKVSPVLSLSAPLCAFSTVKGRVHLRQESFKTSFVAPLSLTGLSSTTVLGGGSFEQLSQYRKMSFLKKLGSRKETSAKLSVGDTVPPLILKDQDGKDFSLGDLRGKSVVLYFYPADDTPGCTKEACAFRDSYDTFLKAGAEVVGVSGDSPESHTAFKAKYNLPFTLLSDEGNKTRKEWGIPSDLFGALAGRQTYVIDKDGKIKLVFNSQLNFAKHVTEALAVINS
ncbi:peroxiredoxin [Klebsormidium nitens]|uniref:thioredoxin-dependent peroxiredoxin n=1 Tax=Klebsormidium nitens TaxID=105231 RepID=A0A1Y1HJ19_KLENI|nr:peroxiredoxin [Klebsormidium nitens]|eukprot:GAQ78504.1 peroxiredoxin [Klebsormidium nitens]